MSLQVKVTWNGPKVQAGMEAKARKALFAAAEEVLKRANEKVPLDAGILQASGETHMDGMPAPPNGPLKGTDREGHEKTVIRPPLQSINEGDLAVAVFYNTPYAVGLHEHPEYEYQGKPDRQGKWLENTINESGPEILKWLADELKF